MLIIQNCQIILIKLTKLIKLTNFQDCEHARDADGRHSSDRGCGYDGYQNIIGEIHYTHC